MFITDQIGRQLEFLTIPVRIISLVPSQTELLIDMGLEGYLVGVTKFCVHPDHIRKSTPVVGGTKHVHYDKIEALQPDIILCNKEENTKEIVETLSQNYTVHVSDIFTIRDSLELIIQYGEIFDKKKKAAQLVKGIETEVESFKEFVIHKPLKKVAYFIWRKPWMVAAGNTFINHLLQMNGFVNIFESKNRYPELDKETISEVDIDLIMLSSEPFPFAEKHIKELKQLVPETTEIKLVDGEFFSWYGSRLLGAFEYFKKLH